MRAVDTNTVIRLIVRDDSRQTAATETFVSKGAWVPLLALAEAVWVLATVYERSTGQQAAAVEMLLRHRDLALEDAETVTEALAVFRAKPGLGFSDCLMLQIARKAGHTAFGTFDRNLAKLDGAVRL